jgi:hypothetical protein
VQDDISQRLDRVLDQVKDAAAQRLAQQTPRPPKAINTLAIAAGMVVLAMGIGVAVQVFKQNRLSPTASNTTTATANIATEKLILTPLHTHTTGSGSQALHAVLMQLRNDTGVAVMQPRVKVRWYDGDQLIDETSVSASRDVLLPNETQAVVLNPSSLKKYTRYELEKMPLLAPNKLITGGVLKLSTLRFVRTPDGLVLEGGLQNMLGYDLSAVAVDAVAYDTAGKVLALGVATFSPAALAAGRSADVQLRFRPMGDISQIKALEYTISANQVDAANRVSTRPIAAAGRTVRLEIAPESGKI